ncbi:MAG: HD domain-containing protein [Treponema sp.]|nr:HD domain-containing protein [Treponema sp.]
MLNLTSVNESFNMDELDNWTTTVGLVQSIVKFVENEIPSCSVHLFFHSAEFHEYREIDREGITSFSDDSIFIGCLSMVTELIPLEKMFLDFQIDDPMINEVMRALYNGRYLVPIVHGFEMISFLLICAKDPAQEEILTDENKDMLNRLSTKIQINLYAASVATRGQKELLRIAEYPFILQKHEDLNAVNTSLFNDIKKEISFNKGVAYRYIDAAHSLSPFAYYKVDEDKVPNLRVGEGISGQVFQTWKPIFVPDRKGHPAYSLMKEESFLDDSIISVPFGTNQERLGVITISRRKSSNKESFSLEHQYMMQIASSFFAVETINRKLYQQLENNEMRFVKGLTHTLEEKDKYTQGHSDRVAKYSVAIGKRMGYDPTRLKLLNYGAQLHDIGKIGISDDIINKPDKLSDEEFKTIKNHTDLGYNILAANPYFDKVKEFVLYHHETLDGKGYHHIMGDKIPEEAMVISCADIYDALTSDRSYRKALERKQALQILATNIGTHFTQEIYDAFVQYLKDDAPTEA